jgi:PmbA protein
MQEVDGTRIPELKSIVSESLQLARKLGASQAEADVSLQKGLTTTVRLGEVETVEYQRDRGMGITVYFGKRKGSASTADLSPRAVAETVEKACDIARYTAEDECSGLADPDELARDIPELDLDHPWDLPPEQAVETARECEAAGRVVDSRITNSEGASVSSHRGVRVYGNSHGFLEGFPSTSHSVSCVLLAQAGDDMQRDYWYASARDARELESSESIGRKAGERAVARLGARKIGTQKARVLYAPEVARGLIGHFLGAVRGSSQYRKSSFLLGASGQKVFPSFVELRERPHILKALGSSPFDGEGVATRNRDLVNDGVLQGYILGSYSARKLGLKTTGNAGGTHNVLVESKNGGMEIGALMRELGTGLLVTELMGQGVNGVTGDYSRGASGYWVENGVQAYPVHEITIAGNLKDMYNNIAAIGNDVDVRGGVRVGSILISEMTIAGD